MNIGGDQLSQLKESARADSEERIVKLLQEHFGESSVWPSDEKAPDLVHAAVDKAAGHGMTTEADAFKVAVMMMTFGPSFDESEWAAPILNGRTDNAPVGNLLYNQAIEQMRRLEPQAPAMDAGIDAGHDHAGGEGSEGGYGDGCNC
jgi:hypothetical protein